MRVLPLITAATIGLFATAAVAQNMNTTDPNSAPGASRSGGKMQRPARGEVKKMDTTDPNSAPGASATGAPKKGASTGAGGPDQAMHKKVSKKHKKVMKKEM